MGRNVAAMKKAVLLLVSFLAASAAHSQSAGVVTLRANATSATGSMAPVLTWSTNPVATSCSASGGWSGTKAASGTQTLATITASTNYTLTCTWGTGTARVSWVAPTANTDGSALVNLASYRVYYGASAGALSQNSEVSDITLRSATISSLTPGTWYFSVRAVNTNRVESGDSNIATKAVTGASAASTVGITINSTPPPPPPTGTGPLVTIATVVYDTVQTGSSYTLGRVVGTIPLGIGCVASIRIGTTDYYSVPRDKTKFTVQPRSHTNVARCARR
jgi:hypothetical protein